MKQIAMILHTNGLEFDDRIRKEILTVMDLFPEIKFKIFAIIDGNQNVEENGVSSYGVEYMMPLLKTRLKYKQGTHVFAKAYDFYKTVKPHLKDFDAIWCADFDTFFFVLLSNKKIIWDMHETPQLFLGNSLLRSLLKYMMKRCRAVIHANPQRLEYMESIKAISNQQNQFVIRNYPQFNEADKQTDEKLSQFKRWLGNSQCAYLQGINNQSRCAEESIDAVMNISNLKGVVVGRFNKEIKSKLIEKYGASLDEKIFFTDMVRQQMTPHYIKCCVVSLVLYRNSSPNNFYCEPNRMFQSIINGCPVVVGCNPPMKAIVDQYGFGVSLEDDGNNVQNVVEAINFVLGNRDELVSNIEKNSDKLLWNQQENVFRKIISCVFENLN